LGFGHRRVGDVFEVTRGVRCLVLQVNVGPVLYVLAGLGRRSSRHLYEFTPYRGIRRMP
jgi:hypothetical protein